jgi:ArsR family transcriptional regulator
MSKTEDKARFFYALSDNTRLEIIKYLMKREECTCICELADILKKDQSVISRHIQILKETGIINAVKDSRNLICCIKDRKKIKMMLED